MRAVGAGTLDPLAHGGLGEIHVARDGADGLALVEHQADDAGFEVIGELATRASLWCAGHRSGHRIPRWEDVHRFGSMPPSGCRRLADPRRRMLVPLEPPCNDVYTD